MTGILYHDDFLQHNTGIGHPERPGRVTAITEALKNADFADSLIWDEPRLATEDEIAEIHDRDYIRSVRESSAARPMNLDPDTLVSKGSYNAALRASGAVLTAIDGVMGGTYKNAFCPVRPPGHHSRYSKAMGFCLFNNVAIGARYIKNKHRIRKILIVDFDGHHGNGTEESFKGDNDILFFSIHQHPAFPGTGMGTKVYAHSGGIFNYPVPFGTGEDVYLWIFNGQLTDYVNLFEPEFILISAGFDGHAEDPLLDLDLASESYYKLTRVIAHFASLFCESRIVSVLEGGYNLEALGESAAYHVKALVEG
jgi:acetoin utilization deacetylase AcuC-like enzyme